MPEVLDSQKVETDPLDKTGGAPIGTPADRMMADITKFARGQDLTKPKEPEIKTTLPQPKPGEEEDEAVHEDTESAEKLAKATESLTDDPKPKVAADEPKKKGAWKLVEDYKTQVKERDKLLADKNREIETLKSAKPAETPEIKSLIEVKDKRITELEDEIRFVNYQKHPEFVEKFQKPYEKAWKDALYDLKGLKVPTQDGATREINAQDLQYLAGLDPDQSRDFIKQHFPEDAAEVRAHVKEIKRLADAHLEALEEARKNGGEHEKKRREEWQGKVTALQTENATIYTKLHAEALEKHEFLKPVDGDVERNEKLTKGTTFVKEALKQNANDPRLTPDQRTEIIRKHVAVENRAIAYSVLKHENAKLKAQLAEREKALAEYEESEPGAGEGERKTVKQSASGSPMDALANDLKKYTS